MILEKKLQVMTKETIYMKCIIGTKIIYVIILYVTRLSMIILIKLDWIEGFMHIYWASVWVGPKL